MRKFVSGNLNYSSWSIRALLMVRHLGLEVEEEIVPLDFPDTTARLAEISPTRKVPLLLTDDETVWDSLAIIEWLADRYPDAGVWPADPKARARARAISAEMHSGFPALRRECPMDIRSRHGRPEMSEALANDILRVDAIWSSALETSGGPYLFGEWSAADAVYAPVVTRFLTYDLPRSTTAQAYIVAVMSHPLMVKLAAEAAAEPWWIKYDENGRSAGFTSSEDS